MGYKYDTHVHTSMVSACASLTAEEIVDLYVQNGYTGIFITDHFIHGNCHEYIRKLDYKNKIIEFYKGYMYYMYQCLYSMTQLDKYKKLAEKVY